MSDPHPRVGLSMTQENAPPEIKVLHFQSTSGPPRSYRVVYRGELEDPDSRVSVEVLAEERDATGGDRWGVLEAPRDGVSSDLIQALLALAERVSGLACSYPPGTSARAKLARKVEELRRQYANVQDQSRLSRTDRNDRLETLGAEIRRLEEVLGTPANETSLGSTAPDCDVSAMRTAAEDVAVQSPLPHPREGHAEEEDVAAKRAAAELAQAEERVRVLTELWGNARDVLAAIERDHGVEGHIATLTAERDRLREALEEIGGGTAADGRDHCLAVAARKALAEDPSVTQTRLSPTVTAYDFGNGWEDPSDA